MLEKPCSFRQGRLVISSLTFANRTLCRCSSENLPVSKMLKMALTSKSVQSTLAASRSLPAGHQHSRGVNTKQPNRHRFDRTLGVRLYKRGLKHKVDGHAFVGHQHGSDKAALQHHHFSLRRVRRFLVRSSFLASQECRSHEILQPYRSERTKIYFVTAARTLTTYHDSSSCQFWQ